MTGADLHEMLADNRELISDTWYFFLTVHMALLAIVYIAHRRTRFPERVFLLAAYTGFVYVNYMAQRHNYENFAAIVGQLKALPDTAEHAIAKALAPPYARPWIADWLIHVYAAAAFISSLIILFVNRRGDHE